MTENKSNAVKIVSSLVNLVGVTAGIIIVAIGSIMFLESIFKIYIFDIKEDKYNSFEYRCDQFDIDNIEARRLLGQDFGPIHAKTIVKDIKNLSEEEKEFLRKKYNQCVEDAKQKSQKQYLNNRKMNIATGLAFIIVGFPLLYFYQRRRKRLK